MAVTAPAPRVLADVLPRSIVRDVVLIVAGAAFVGLAAQISIPLSFTPVPLTMQTFAVLLTGAALGSVRGVLSMLLYAVVGVLGVPWFAEGASGFAMPSFGYIIGFVLAAGLVGYLAERNWTRTALDTALAMVLGNVVIYAVGVTWLKLSLPAITWAGAIELGMSPFLVGDAIKILLAAGLFPLLWKGLTRFGLAPREADDPTESRVVETAAVVETPMASTAETTVATSVDNAVDPSAATPVETGDETAEEAVTDGPVLDLTDGTSTLNEATDKRNTD